MLLVRVLVHPPALPTAAGGDSGIEWRCSVGVQGPPPAQKQWAPRGGLLKVWSWLDPIPRPLPKPFLRGGSHVGAGLGLQCPCWRRARKCREKRRWLRRWETRDHAAGQARSPHEAKRGEADRIPRWPTAKAYMSGCTLAMDHVRAPGFADWTGRGHCLGEKAHPGRPSPGWADESSRRGAMTSSRLGSMATHWRCVEGVLDRVPHASRQTHSHPGRRRRGRTGRWHQGRASVIVGSTWSRCHLPPRRTWLSPR